MQNSHELAVHDRKLGLIGRLTGSTNPSLNIAAMIAMALLTALLLCISVEGWVGKGVLSPYIERLIAAVLAVAGFIFGVQQGGQR